MFRRVIGGWVDAAGRRPLVVLLLSFLFVVGCFGYTKKYLELRSDFLELLPRNSPGFMAFEHQLGRVGGGATFLVVVESPDRAANQRLVDDLGGALQKQADDRTACVKACKDDACKAACGPDFISYVEMGTKDLQSFFDHQQWLYASLPDLIEADDTLDHQIAISSGLVDDLEAPNKPAPAPKTSAASPSPGPGAPAADAKQPTLGMDKFYDRWKDAAKKHNDYPSGYFTNDAGTVMVIRIVSNASGTGGYSGDLFLADMNKRVSELHYKEKYHPEMKVGFAGDIPNAVAEKESTISEAAWASGAAFFLILAGIVFYYRSPWALVIVSVPAFMGVGAAYAFATAVFGYVNTPGAFLGAIIVGNGINYPIVLLSRYREFRARGMEREEARREAVLNAFRAELVGASVASIAYGSLTITQFRGFSQFGTIGFVGMLLVWVAIVPVVPALIVSFEWLQEKVLPGFLRDPAERASKDGSSGPVMRFIARATARFPAAFIIVPLLVTAFFVTKIPAYLRDPWEYNFNKLGSRSSKQAGGAGEWSNKADEVFRGKQNISGTLILADTPQQVAPLEKQILANDKTDPQGTLIDEIVTIEHFLPGTAAEQQKKLEVLDRMRDRLTPYVLSQVSETERKRLEELRPPEDLKVVEGKELPPLIRRRFEENNGVIGTLMYIKYQYGVHYSDGRTLLRMANTTDNVKLPDGTTVQTASRSTIFAEMIRSMERDGPLATAASFLAVMVVVILATRSRIGSFSVLLALLMGVASLVGLAAYTDTKLNFFNFIALPITFGIGCEYPFNVYDRVRLLKGDVKSAVARTGGAVALCSYTTTVGYGSMLFSDNQALQSFGKLAMWGEIACTTTALFFLPSLLHVLLGTRRNKVVAAP
ncbi:MAG: exporters of the superfamily [Labilithrix sp.]|nr:exporters of the superfamily [Labilithrix sp.]